VIQFDCVTLFPQMFAAVAEHGITRRAREEGRWSLTTWNPRDFTTDAHRTVDDRPYGGGPGMVMLAEPLEKAIGAAQARVPEQRARVILLSPQGAALDHAKVLELASAERLVLVCARYEAVDERLVGRAIDEEISIGDYVLSGGELAAMVVIDAIVRQLPGARIRRRRSRSWTGFSTARTTRGPRRTRASGRPRCSSRGTTRRSSAGGSSSRSAGRGCDGLTCLRSGG
jgi:tRNA (guanine37-N1)-methyltransferase